MRSDTPINPLPEHLAPPLAGRMLAAPNADFVLAEWTDSGGLSNAAHPIAPLHVHHRGEEAWYVLAGTLGIRSGDRDVLVPAGAGLLVPRGTPHTFWNAGPNPVRYLLVMSAEIQALIRDLHALNTHDPEAVRAVYRRYHSDLLE